MSSSRFFFAVVLVPRIPLPSSKSDTVLILSSVAAEFSVWPRSPTTAILYGSDPASGLAGAANVRTADQAPSDGEPTE